MLYILNKNRLFENTMIREGGSLIVDHNCTINNKYLIFWVKPLSQLYTRRTTIYITTLAKY